MEDRENEKDKELAKNLEAAANALLSPPPSVQQLLPLLFELEKCFTVMDQSTPECVKKAINLAMNALTANELLHNEDEDVRVSVALCITEIMRITAPDGPCDDEELMKELFSLIVSAFDKISDISRSSYLRRVTVLKNFGKFRLWNLMLDLKCDSLILQMFNHFLGNIREYHPECVFMNMGLIMIMVLDEIDEIPLELLSPLLGCLRKRNRNVLPIARKLGERVIENSDSKLKSCMHQAVRYSGYPLKDYGKIVAYVYEQSMFLENKHCEVLASKDSCTENCQALENKDNPLILLWSGNKKRGNSKISAKHEKLSAKISLASNEDEHFVGNSVPSEKEVQCLKEQKFSKGDMVSYDPMEKKQKVQNAELVGDINVTYAGKLLDRPILDISCKQHQNRNSRISSNSVTKETM